MVNARQRVDGSIPSTRTTSREPKLVSRATRIRVVGQTMRRCPSSRITFGRLTWKS
jgi:hypothetical protein